MRRRSRVLVAVIAAITVLGLVSAPTASAAGTGFTISGRVTSADGYPMADGSVTVMFNGSGTARGTADSSGAYSIQVPAGAYVVWVTARESLSASTDYSFFVSGTVDVSNDAVDNFVLPRVGRLDVTVRDSDGAAVPDGTTVNAQQSVAPITDSLGNSFSAAGSGTGSSAETVDSAAALDVIQGSTVTLQFGVQGQADTLDTLDMPAAASYSVDVATASTVAISGRVTRSDGSIPDALVELDAQSGGEVRPVIGSDGSYSAHVVPGAYRIVVFDGGTETAPASASGVAYLNVADDTTEDIDVPAISPVSVTVRDDSGAPVAGSIVNVNGIPADYPDRYPDDGTFFWDSSPFFRTAFTGADGTAAGWARLGSRIQVEATSPGGQYLRTSSVTVDAAPFDADIDLPALNASLVGSVTDGTDLPVVSSTVTVTNDDGTATTQVAPDGSYSLAVDPGDYDMTVTRVVSTGPSDVTLAMTATGSVDLTSGTTRRDLAFPGAADLHVSTVDANDVPISQATYIGPTEARGDLVTGGASYLLTSHHPSSYLGDHHDGTADFIVARGTGIDFDVTPPNGVQVGDHVDVESATQDETVRIASYGVLTSAGPVAGAVQISAPTGLTLSKLTDTPVVADPDGGTALVGAVGYALSGLQPGASADVTLTLPAGSRPQHAFKVDQDGSTESVDQLATFSGNTVVLHLTDGGPGDEDEVANGVIVDPVVLAGTSVPVIRTSSVPTGVTGNRYSAALTATGTGPLAWAISSGAVPAGLTLTRSGTLSGLPTRSGRSTFTAAVTGPGGTTSRSFTIIVDQHVAVSTTSLPAGRLGVAYSTTLRSTGGSGSRTWSVSAGRLPAGLTLSHSGTLTGRPSAAASARITVRVAAANGNVATRTLSITVRPMEIATTALASARRGRGYSATLRVVGGTGPYSWTLASGRVPAGLRLTASGHLAGSPRGRGRYTFEFRVSDRARHTAIRWIKLIVN